MSGFLETVPHPAGEAAKQIPPKDGIYDGTWTGYTVSFVVEGVPFTAMTLETGIRGAIRCVVTVQGGRIRVREFRRRCGE